jgi:hypothetical protein
MFAKIYVPARNATQSGRASSEVWVLEYEPEQASEIEPLMGWTGNGDMRSQLRIKFSSRQEAIGYAERNGIAYQVMGDAPKKRVIKKSYSDNFRYGRKHPWTH